MSPSGPEDDDVPYVPSEQLTFAWLDRLQRSASRENALEAIEDLRDNAYDLPQAWESFTAVRFLHFLGELLGDADDGDTNWEYFGLTVGQAIAKARSETPTNWEA